MTLDAAKIIEDRESSHGYYPARSAMCQELKRVMGRGNWKHLSDSQAEALDMIAVKISRILNGDPNNKDHWGDIAGYAILGTPPETTEQVAKGL